MTGFTGTPANTHAATDTVTGAWGSGQTRTAGNLLIAVCTASFSTAGSHWPGETSGGWLLIGFSANTTTATDTIQVCSTVWAKVAAGSDAAPVFDVGSAGTNAMDCILFEISGAALQVDAIGTYSSSGTGTSSGTLSSMSATTSTDVSAAGEYAISVFAQYRAAGNLTWTEAGSGWTNALGGNGVSSELQTAVNYRTSPASGAGLADSGHFSTDTTAWGAGIVIVIPAVSPDVPQIVKVSQVEVTSSATSYDWTVSSQGGTTLLLAAEFYDGKTTAPAVSSVADSASNTWQVPSSGTSTSAPPSGSSIYSTYSGLAALMVAADAAAISSLTIDLSESGEPLYLTLIELANMGSATLGNAGSNSTPASGSSASPAAISTSGPAVIVTVVSSSTSDIAPYKLTPGWMAAESSPLAATFDVRLLITPGAVTAAQTTFSNYGSVEWISSAAMALLPQTAKTATAALTVTPAFAAAPARAAAASLTVTPSFSAAGKVIRGAVAALAVVPVLAAASVHAAPAALTVTPTFSAHAEATLPRTAALTVTPSFSSAAAHAATASLTVTPSFSVTGESELRTASAALHVTPAFSAAAAGKQVRTASLTVTPSFSATGIVTRDRTASLTVTPAFSAPGVAVRPGTASLTVTPSFSAHAVHAVAPALTVTPSFAAHAAHTATAALTVTPAFSAHQVATRDRTAALTVTPSFSGQAGSQSRTASLTVTPSFSAAGTGELPRTAALTIAPVLSAEAQTVIPATVTGTYTTHGSYTVTAPSGMAAPAGNIQLQGAGGGSGGNGGSGGGGGEYAAEPAYSLTSGDAYALAVGTAGAAGTTTGNGGAGGNTTFASTGVVAHGGGGGAEEAGTAGAGGTGASSTTHHNGGAGGKGYSGKGTVYGGGGGGSGGTTGAGNAGTAATSSGAGSGGSAVTGGGAGGAGSGSGNGTAGSAPGGGAGGGASSSAGAAGADGKAVITLTVVPGAEFTAATTGGTWEWTAPAGVIRAAWTITGTASFDGNTSSGAETVTPGDSYVISVGTSGSLTLTWGAKTGTAALTVTPAFSAAGETGTLTARAALTVTPVFSAKPATTAGLHVTPAFSTAQQILHAAPAALTITPSFGSSTVSIIGFPENPLPVKIELLLNGTWTDITAYVYQRADIQITAGRTNETQQATPAQCTLVVNNRGGTFTPQCTGGIFYPNVIRNTQIRVSVQRVASADGTTFSGYRFWGEVSSWPPQWDPSGTDIYASITASGVLRRLGQGYNIGSPLARYYQNLPASAQIAAYWPCEDASGSSVISAGIAGGDSMSITGTPDLGGDSDVNGSDPFLTLSGGTLTGETSSFGASGDDVYITPGTYEWIAPPGITSPEIVVVGGGGGGAAGTATANGDGTYTVTTGGGGGGGGSSVSTGYTVTPGNSYTVVVGAGGAPGAAGSQSSFDGTLTGKGASGATGNNGASGGTGTGGTHQYTGGKGAKGGTGSSSSKTFTFSQSWTAPAGTTQVSVSLWGGGGGGQGGTSVQGGNGGGGGGAAAGTEIAVTAGTAYTVTVGAGGAGGTATLDGDSGGTSSFAGDSDTVSATGGGGGGTGSRAGGTGTGAGTSPVGTTGGEGGSYNGFKGGGGGGSAGSPLGADGSMGFNAVGSTGAAGGQGSSYQGAGGSGGNGGGGTGANAQAGSAYGGGGGGGGQGSNGGAGGAGAQGAVQLGWSASETSGGGGGGGSAGSAGNGSAASGNSGGAAVTGGGPGGPGGQAAAGSTPVNGPGGGGGGGDADSTAGTGYAGAAGYAGQVQILYTPPTEPGTNVLRFLLDVPAAGGTDGAILAQMLTGGTVAKLNVVYHTGGNLELTGYNSGGTQILDSGSQAFGADGQPMIVSAELVNDGTDVGWTFWSVLPLTLPGTATTLGPWTGSVSGACGNVSDIILNSGGTETTAVGVGHVAVQYAVTSLTDLAPVIAGWDGELAGDRFLRLCSEMGFSGRLVGDAYWSFEDGTGDNWTAAHGSLTPGYTAWASVGLESLLVTADGTGQPAASSPSEAIAVAGGDICSAYADVYALASLADLTIAIDWYDDTSTLLSSDTSDAVALTAGSQATISLQGQTAPVDAAWAAVRVYDAETLSDGAEFAVDNAMIFANSQLGPQQDTIMTTVLQQIEDVDQGLLFEPRDCFGLAFRTRKSLENQAAGAVIDYSAAQLSDDGGGIQPVWDDQLTRNDIILTRNNGATLRLTQTTGDMSVQAPPNGVGSYNYQNTVYCHSDTQLTNLTQWILTKGTVDEGRYPAIPVNLARTACAGDLFADVPGLGVGDYLQVENLPAWLPPGTADQLAFGYTETINAFRWVIAFNAVPEAIYASGSLPDW